MKSPSLMKKVNKQQKSRARPFGKLDPYQFRVLLVKNSRDFQDVAAKLYETYGLPVPEEHEIQFKEKTFGHGDQAKSHRFLDLPTPVPIYVMFLQNKESAGRKVVDIFEIAHFLKSSTIVYASALAIPLFKVSLLHNFPTIRLRSPEFVAEYFSDKELIGNDERELLFSLSEKQKYITEEATTRQDFAKKKDDHKPVAPAPSTKQHQHRKKSEEIVFDEPRKKKDAAVPNYKAKLNSSSSSMAANQAAKNQWTMPADVNRAATVNAEALRKVTEPLFMS